jgi:hypothetical protein
MSDVKGIRCRSSGSPIGVGDDGVCWGASVLAEYDNVQWECRYLGFGRVWRGVVGGETPRF